MVIPVATTTYAPNPDDMRRHLEHLFLGDLDGYQDGLIELCWTDATPPHGLKHGRLFGTDAIEDLIEAAVELNSRPGVNVYIGAALRKPDTPPFGRSSREDVLALTALWCDLDEPGAPAAARAATETTRPTMVVVTGAHPHERAQLWWRLDEPLADTERAEAAHRALAERLQGDRKVYNADRVMRLAGSVAWPVKAGRITEQTRIPPMVAPRSPVVMLEAVERMAGADRGRAPSAAAARDEPVRKSSLLGLPGHVTDGRESYMRDTLLATFVEYVGSNGCAPTADELVADAWDQYARNVDLSRPGRGKNEMIRKARYLVAKFERGQLAGLPDLDAVVASYQGRPADRKAAQRPADADALATHAEAARAAASPSEAAPDPMAGPAPDTFTTLSIGELLVMPPPQWLVDGLILEKGLTFLYGPPGKGKSFLALDLAMHVAHGMQWTGRDTKPGGVLYIAGEGVAGYPSRVAGWLRRHKPAQAGAFRLLPVAPRLMVEDDIKKLVATIAAQIHDARLVVIDTVARTIPGAEENASKEMGLFVAACDAIQRACGVSVVGIHHSGKDEDRGMRGSSALEGAGDAVFQFKRGDGQIAELICRKMKEAEEPDPIRFELTREEWIDPAHPLKPTTTLVPVVIAEGGALPFPNPLATEAILRVVRTQWAARKPWSMALRTKVEGRHLPTWIAQKYQVTDDAANAFCQSLLADEVLIADEFRTSQRKIRIGLRTAECPPDATTKDGETDE